MPTIQRNVAPPDAKIIGRSFTAFIDNVSSDQLQPIVDKFKIDELDLDQFYPVQLYLDIVAEVEAQIGSNGLTAVGMSIIDKASFPPLDGLEAALNSLHPVYDNDHRNAGEGWRTEYTGEKEALVYLLNPYPLNFCYGVVYALTRRFCPDDHDFDVEIMERLEENGKHDILKVTWFPDE